MIKKLKRRKKWKLTSLFQEATDEDARWHSRYDSNFDKKWSSWLDRATRSALVVFVSLVTFVTLNFYLLATTDPAETEIVEIGGSLMSKSEVGPGRFLIFVKTDLVDGGLPRTEEIYISDKEQFDAMSTHGSCRLNYEVKTKRPWILGGPIKTYTLQESQESEGPICK